VIGPIGFWHGRAVRVRGPSWRTATFAAALVGAMAGAGAADRAQAEPAGPVAIAVTGPFAGRFAQTGAQMELGVRQALARINAGGGLLGHDLIAVAVDDGCRAAEAKTVAERLTTQDIALVIGPACSGAALAAAPIYAAAGRIMITPTARHPRLSDARAGPTIFRLAPREDRQGAVIGKAMADEFAGKRVVLLHDYTSYGKGLALEAERTMRSNRLQPVLTLAFSAGEPDYHALAQRLQQLAPDAIFIGSNIAEFAMIAKQLRAYEVNARLLGGDVLKSDQFIRLAGTAGEGTLIAFPPIVRFDFDAADRPSATPKPPGPGGPALAAHDAVEAWAEAVRRAGTFAPLPVAEALNAAKLETTSGGLWFDRKGDANLAAFAIYELAGGVFREHAAPSGQVSDPATPP